MRFDDFLSHYGIPGMKWGIRRTAEELGNLPNNAGNAFSAAGRLRAGSKKGKNDVKKMSDEELSRRVRRLNMEKQYSDLTKSDTSRGFERARDILSVIGGIATITATGLTIYDIIQGKDPKSNKK